MRSVHASPATAAQAPHLIEAETGGDPAGWAEQQHDTVRVALAEHGAVLIRGLAVTEATRLGELFGALAPAATAEVEPFAPRTRLAEGVWSATPWPASQQMCMHHESSYAVRFPGTLLFGCTEAAASGGETGLADAAAVLADLPADLTERFLRDGWLLVRTYSDEIGASVEEVFGTGDRAAVEAYCRDNGIEFEWRADGGLRTVQRRPAVVRHPVTGKRCWFNQIAFLSEWTMDPDVREFLVEDYGPDGLPFTTRFGNGDPVDEETVTAINAVYDRHTVRHTWAAGDVLVVDNIATAHGRQPFTGGRVVVAGLADAVEIGDCAPEFGVGAR